MLELVIPNVCVSAMVGSEQIELSSRRRSLIPQKGEKMLEISPLDTKLSHLDHFSIAKEIEKRRRLHGRHRHFLCDIHLPFLF